MTYLVIIKWYN